MLASTYYFFSSQLTTSGNQERSSVLPHLMFTENSTQLDLIFENVETEQFANARLGVELITIASEPNNPFSSSISHSLDDEYTPGVFKVWFILSKCVAILIIFF